MFSFLKKDKQSEIEELQSKIAELTEVIHGKDEVIARLVDREKTRVEQAHLHPFINTWEDLKLIQQPEPLVDWLYTRDLETVAIVLRSVNEQIGEEIAKGYTDEECEKMAIIMQKMPSYTMKDKKIKRVFEKVQELYA